jgi:hypothetical protein
MVVLAIVGFATPFLAGFITQRMIAVRRPWACGAGSLVFALTWPSLGTLTIKISSGLLLVLIGSFGARVAWRGSRDEQPAVPAATLQ